jgi:hypothetical protein
LLVVRCCFCFVEEIGAQLQQRRPETPHILVTDDASTLRRILTLWHIGLKSNSLLLTIIADIDTSRSLSSHNIFDGAIHLLVELVRINRLSALLPK